jgi:3,4-dihydroxy 2-butanone 4-phosphate synthase / GTP cyclohydrolase II
LCNVLWGAKMNLPFDFKDRVAVAIDAFKAGRLVIMVDDEKRENEGDLVFPASIINKDVINFMSKEARGLICLSLCEAMVEKLHLPMMEDSTKPLASRETAFTVSIEAKHGVTTGISAQDRCHTIQTAVADKASPEHIVVPGHIFPLKAKPGGVLARAGHTEGSVDLARMAGFKGAAVICEIMNDDGSMARLEDLQRFSDRHSIPIVSIEDLITYRLMEESLIEKVESQKINTDYGRFFSHLFKSEVDHLTHFALTNFQSRHDIKGQVVNVRVHRQRTLVDVFANKNAGRKRIDYGLQMLKGEDPSVFVYLIDQHPQEHFLQELAELASCSSGKGQDENHTGPNFQMMNYRSLGVGAQILRALGVEKMRVHMSYPSPLKGLAGFGLTVCDTVPIPLGEG